MTALLVGGKERGAREKAWKGFFAPLRMTESDTCGGRLDTTAFAQAWPSLDDRARAA